MFLQCCLVCFVVLITCFNTAAYPLDNDEATVDDKATVDDEATVHDKATVDDEANVDEGANPLDNDEATVDEENDEATVDEDSDEATVDEDNDEATVDEDEVANPLDNDEATVDEDKDEATVDEDKDEATVDEDNDEATVDEDNDEATVDEDNNEATVDEDNDEATVDEDEGANPLDNDEATVDEDSDEATVDEDNGEAIVDEDNDETTVDEDEEPSVGPIPQIDESLVDIEESHRRLVRETCDPKWANIDPQHTMCLNDVGVEVVLDAATKAALLKQHNDLRSQVVPLAADMTKMVWDEELALVAAKWARQCVVGHEPGTARLVPSLPRVNVGQNAAFGHSTFEEGIRAWFDENKNFLYGNGSTGGEVGHYTQVVAARSQRVGCGQADCSGYKYGKYYFCNYAVGQMTQDTLKPYTNSSVSCSACPTKCDASGKLCDCQGKVCLNGGTFKLATCSCSCASPFTGDICQTLNCPKSDPWYCNTLWAPSFCKLFSNVPNQCPYMCGVCTASG